MPKPESNFIARIHRKVSTDIYKQAMGLTAMNGTPDYYYEGPGGYVWIEYKWYPQKPATVDLCNKKKKPHLSALQQHWLNRAYLNNQPVMVVAGYPGGCFILKEGQWNAIGLPVRHVDHPVEDVVEVINGLGNSVKNSRKSKLPV